MQISGTGSENHIIILDDDSQAAVNNSKTAWFCGIVFLLLACLFPFLRFQGGATGLNEMKTWLLVAVAPSLFCLGIRLTARALKRDAVEEQHHELAKFGANHTMASFFVPVSLTILLTHFIGFELALPLGVTYYGGLVWLSTERLLSESDVYFRFLFGAALGVAFFLGLVRIGLS